MNTELIISIVTSVLTILATLIGYYFKIKASITEKANELISSAEDTQKIGEEKMEIVVNELYHLVPVPYRIFFTKSWLKKLVQVLFDAIEDYASKQSNKKVGD